MITQISGFPQGVVAVSYSGLITAEDYEKTLIPITEEALKANQKVRFYCEVEEFEGFRLGAIFDDLKLGFEHLSRLQRTVVVTNVDWIRHYTNFWAFLLPGLLKVFTFEEKDQAREWVCEGLK